MTTNDDRARLDRIHHARQLGDAWVSLEAQLPELIHQLREDGHSWPRIAALLGGIRSDNTLKRKYGGGKTPPLHSPHRLGPRSATDVGGGPMTTEETHRHLNRLLVRAQVERNAGTYPPAGRLP